MDAVVRFAMEKSKTSYRSGSVGNLDMAVAVV